MGDGMKPIRDYYKELRDELLSTQDSINRIIKQVSLLESYGVSSERIRQKMSEMEKKYGKDYLLREEI